MGVGLAPSFLLGLFFVVPVFLDAVVFLAVFLAGVLDAAFFADVLLLLFLVGPLPFLVPLFMAFLNLSAVFC